LVGFLHETREKEVWDTLYCKRCLVKAWSRLFLRSLSQSRQPLRGRCARLDCAKDWTKNWASRSVVRLLMDGVKDGEATTKWREASFTPSSDIQKIKSGLCEGRAVSKGRPRPFFFLLSLFCLMPHAQNAQSKNQYAHI
jgi:hypothetical protein